MTLPIDPEHLPAIITTAQTDGVAYLNIEKEPCHTHWHDGDEQCCVCDRRYEIKFGPDQHHEPPEWRELADAVCETCHGMGGNPRSLQDCPDCGGTSKPTHTLTIAPPDDICSLCGDPDCSGVNCNYRGSVFEVDVVVDELVPGEDPTVCGCDICETVLGPPLQPGDWVAVLRTRNTTPNTTPTTTHTKPTPTHHTQAPMNETQPPSRHTIHAAPPTFHVHRDNDGPVNLRPDHPIIKLFLEDPSRHTILLYSFRAPSPTKYTRHDPEPEEPADRLMELVAELANKVDDLSHRITLLSEEPQ